MQIPRGNSCGATAPASSLPMAGQKRGRLLTGQQVGHSQLLPNVQIGIRIAAAARTVLVWLDAAKGERGDVEPGAVILRYYRCVEEALRSLSRA